MGTSIQLLFLLFGLTCARENEVDVNVTTKISERVKRDVEEYIHNGEDGQMATAVALAYGDSKKPFCSGSILSSNRVITVGHCVDQFDSDYGNLRVVAGTADLRNYYHGNIGFEQVFEVESAAIHPYYEKKGTKKVEFDLAILELKTDMNLNGKTMKAVTLPPHELRHEGRKIKVGGWGKLSAYGGQSPVHQVIDIEIHPNKRCKKTYNNGEFDDQQMFCGGDEKQGACKGDSGAGAVHEFNGKSILFGVVSVGYKSDLQTSCMKETIFQRMSASLPWIYRETKIK